MTINGVRAKKTFLFEKPYPRRVSDVFRRFSPVRHRAEKQLPAIMKNHLEESFAFAECKSSCGTVPNVGS